MQAFWWTFFTLLDVIPSRISLKFTNQVLPPTLYKILVESIFSPSDVSIFNSQTVIFVVLSVAFIGICSWTQYAH